MTATTLLRCKVDRSVLLPITALLLGTSILLLGTGSALAKDPTCSDTLGIVTHGQHIIGDYVTGIGHENLAWSPTGEVGKAIGGTGVVVRGGPGPGFHFPNGFAPGASFCNPQAQSPSLHP